MQLSPRHLASTWSSYSAGDLTVAGGWRDRRGRANRNEAHQTRTTIRRRSFLCMENQSSCRSSCHRQRAQSADWVEAPAPHWSPHSAGNLTVAGVTGRIAEEGIDSRNRNSRSPAGEPSGHRGLPSQPGRPDRQRRTREPNQEASCKWRSTSHTAATVAAPTTARTRATRTTTRRRRKRRTTTTTAATTTTKKQRQKQQEENNKNNLTTTLDNDSAWWVLCWVEQQATTYHCNSRTPAGEPSGHRGLPSQPERPDRQRRTREPSQEASNSKQQQQQ